MASACLSLDAERLLTISGLAWTIARPRPATDCYVFLGGREGKRAGDVMPAKPEMDTSWQHVAFT